MTSRYPTLELNGAMSIQAVPNQNDGILNMSKKFLQKDLNQYAIDVRVRYQGKIKSYSMSFGGYGKSSNGRNLFVVASSLMQQRSFPSGSPAPTYQRRHQQARFIQEDDRSFQSPRVFFIRGQSCLIQRWMASSSLSRARRSGFWGVQPMDRNKRQI